MKLPIDRLNRLIDEGLSLITIGDSKIPNFKWKDCQNKALSKSDFYKLYELPTTKGQGIVTGFNGLEVIDIDLKVLNSLEAQQNFWNELLSFFKDNINDFDEKFVIYKTINNGYHVLYRCKRIEGNKKLAKLKGFSEAIIETRGMGGYVFIYDKQVSNLSYNEIQEISEADREVLIQCCKYYNHVNEASNIIPEPKKTDYNLNEITPWEDYNKKTDIWSLISDDFKVVRKLSNKTVIKRNGANSAHSGYVFSDTGFMYLFSTGTIYPNEKLLTPFNIFSYKYHSGDHKQAASDLYKKGYGSRIKKTFPEEIKEKLNIETSKLEFPIDIFPVDLKTYILECHNKLSGSVDYMGCGLLWSTAVIIGNSIKIQPTNGWIESVNLWIALVGRAGVGKTPHLNNVIRPLKTVNNNEIKRYKKEMERYCEYLDKEEEEKKVIEKVKKPFKTQFIAADVTLEALVELHEENKNSIGIHKDELAGWLKDMNKYRQGSDLEFWLSSWSNEGIALNRKTAKSSFVEKPVIPIIGGIQPGIINTFYTDENKNNGFIDRILVSYPDIDINYYNTNQLDNSLLEWYESVMINMFHMVKDKIIIYDKENEIESRISELDSEAKMEWERVFNKITDLQNSENENEYLKSMLPKQKTYILRFSLIIEFLDRCFNDTLSDFIVTKKSILNAEKLSDYFINMARKLKFDSNETSDIKDLIKETKSKSKKNKVFEVWKNDKEFNKSKLADMLSLTRTTIHRYIKEFEQQLKTEK